MPQMMPLMWTLMLLYLIITLLLIISFLYFFIFYTPLSSKFKHSMNSMPLSTWNWMW